MTNTDATPRKAGDPIPPVEPEDIKRLRIFCKQATLARANGNVWREDLQASFSPDTDIMALSSRNAMIETLVACKVLAPWQHGEDFDDAVFRVAANFPIREFWPRAYMIEGDEHFGFDPNAFVQQLVSETGIAGTGKTIPTRVGDGRWWGGSPIGAINETPERLAEHTAREVLWQIFKRFSPILDAMTSHDNKESSTHIAALLFADFLLDNIDLVRQLEDGCKNPKVGCVDVMKELEQRAQTWA
jgi:hypothetical protein